MSVGNLAWRQYICRACGLIYNEQDGDPDSGLAPGTRFEDIPDDWECPLCGVRKTDFELFEPHAVSVAPQPVVISGKPGVVIVGAGIAGWNAAEAIRALDDEVSIVLISSCAADRYHKPELSVAISRRLKSHKLVQESAVSASRRLGVKVVPHTYAVGISPDAKQLRTTRGTFTYLKLILALGSRPFLPAALASAEHMHMNHLDAWGKLSHALDGQKKRVAVVGAGMIGCETAEDLCRAGHRVTLINDKALPLPSFLPDKAAQHLVSALQGLGVNYVGGAEISGTDENSAGESRLIFSDGAAVPYDHLIIATGLVTDTRIAQRAGLAFNRGIVVEPTTLQTSDQHIFALGDCVSFDGAPCRFVEPIPQQAGVIASRVVQREQSTYQHIQPVIRLKTRSLPIVIRGVPEANGRWHTVREDNEALVMEQYVGQQAIASLTLDLSRQKNAA